MPEQVRMAREAELSRLRAISGPQPARPSGSDMVAVIIPDPHEITDEMLARMDARSARVQSAYRRQRVEVPRRMGPLMADSLLVQFRHRSAYAAMIDAAIADLTRPIFWVSSIFSVADVLNTTIGAPIREMRRTVDLRPQSCRAETIDSDGCHLICDSNRLHPRAHSARTRSGSRYSWWA